MHIYKKPSGTWAYRIDVGRDPVTGRRKQREKAGFPRARDARMAAEEALRALRRNEYVEPERVTFSKFAADWLATYEQVAKVSSVRIRRHQVGILNRYFGKLSLQFIKKKAYQDALLTMAATYKPATISGVHAAARMIFKKAREYELIYTDPTEFAVVPRPKRTIVDPDKNVPPYLEKAQLQAFLQAAMEKGLYPDYPLFVLLSYTGLRIGEALALTWEDVDFAGNALKVSKTLYNPTNNACSYELLPPKTVTSVRVVSMPQHLKKVLTSYKLEASKHRLDYDHEWHYPKGSRQGFVFTAPAHPGYPLTQRLVQLRIDRLQKLMDPPLPIRIHPHLFRHTHASLLAEAGVDLVNIMKRLGHSDDATTRQIYLHITKSLAQETAQRFDDLLAK